MKTIFRNLLFLFVAAFLLGGAHAQAQDCASPTSLFIDICVGSGSVGDFPVCYYSGGVDSYCFEEIFGGNAGYCVAGATPDITGICEQILSCGGDIETWYVLLYYTIGLDQYTFYTWWGCWPDIP